MATKTEKSGASYVTVVSKKQLKQMVSKDTKPTAGMDTILARRRARLDNTRG